MYHCVEQDTKSSYSGEGHGLSKLGNVFEIFHQMQNILTLIPPARLITFHTFSVLLQYLFYIWASLEERVREALGAKRNVTMQMCDMHSPCQVHSRGDFEVEKRAGERGASLFLCLLAYFPPKLIPSCFTMHPPQ